MDLISCTILFFTFKIFCMLLVCVQTTEISNSLEEDPCNFKPDESLGPGLSKIIKRTASTGNLKAAIKGFVEECKSIKKDQSKQLNNLVEEETKYLLKNIDLALFKKDLHPTTIRNTDDALKFLNGTGLMKSLTNVLPKIYFNLKRFCTKNKAIGNITHEKETQDMSYKPFQLVATEVTNVIFAKASSGKEIVVVKRGFMSWFLKGGKQAIGVIVANLIVKHIVRPVVEETAAHFDEGGIFGKPKRNVTSRP